MEHAIETATHDKEGTAIRNKVYGINLYYERVDELVRESPASSSMLHGNKIFTSGNYNTREKAGPWDISYMTNRNKIKHGNIRTQSRGTRRKRKIAALTFHCLHSDSFQTVPKYRPQTLYTFQTSQNIKLERVFGKC
jgi:hypothetical protein